jgi:hypothetical protein
VESGSDVIRGSGAPWSLVVWTSWLRWPLLHRFIFSLLTLLFSSGLTMPFFSWYTGVTYLSYFQPTNSAVNPEGRTPTSSVVAFLQNSSDTGKCLHWSTISIDPVIPEERCIGYFCWLLAWLYQCNDAFQLLTDNIAFVSMVCYFDLFSLCFRIQINLWKEKGGPLNQQSMSFLRAAVAATIACIIPVHQLF